MKRSFRLTLACAFALSAAMTSSAPVGAAPSPAPSPAASAPAAGEIPLGVTVIELKELLIGWSVRKELLGKGVQNDKKENLGKIEDVIVSPANSLSYAIVGVGGFLPPGLGARVRLTEPRRHQRTKPDIGREGALERREVAHAERVNELVEKRRGRDDHERGSIG